MELREGKKGFGLSQNRTPLGARGIQGGYERIRGLH